MVEIYSFGYWVLRRRKALDLTRKELARRVGCASETIKKIERDERRPSHQVARLLADALTVPSEEQGLFLQVARGERSFERLHLNSEPLTAWPIQQHNLPVQLTSFIGRQGEILDLQARLEDPNARLCTILGPGGMGKTRLALQLASRCLEAYPGGVWLVGLADLSNPVLVPREVSTSLGISEQSQRQFSEVLVDYLKSRPRLLLLLDNCEHLLDACADLCTLLLKNCPGLQILATSRQALRVKGESLWLVGGLSLAEEPVQFPTNQGPDPERSAEGSDAIRLFLERARLVQPHFQLTAGNLPHVTRICQSLDGMPLAIELAAARMSVLSAEEIAALLDERFQFLQSTARETIERHQTLLRVVDWSYSLLGEAERSLFNSLSVFRSGFTLESAEAVVEGLVEGTAALDLLAFLVEKSMVTVESEATTGTRYRLLETLRLYGYEHLVKSGKVEIALQQHALYYMALAEKADPELRGPHQIAWLQILQNEHDNFSAALEWSAKHEPRIGLRLGAALLWFWIIRGYFTEGREWLEIFLEDDRVPVFDPIHVRAFVRYVHLMGYLLDNQQLFRLAEESLQRAKAVEDVEGIAMSLLEMAGDPYYVEDVRKSRSLLEESVALFQACGNLWGKANALRRLAALNEVRLFNHSEARKILSEAMDLFHEVGDIRGISSVLLMLGQIERHMGNWHSANRYFQECLSYRRELHDSYSMAVVLWKLGSLAALQDNLAQAIRLCQASLEIFRKLHVQDMTVMLLGVLAYLFFLTGETRKAEELCQESLAIAQKSHNQRAMLNAVLTQGEIALSRGDPAAALRYFRDSLVLVSEYSLTQDNTVYVLEALAGLTVCQGKYEQTVKLLSAAGALRKMIDKIFLIPKIQARWDVSLEQSREYLDEAAFAAAWDEGQASTVAGWECVIAYAMREIAE